MDTIQNQNMVKGFNEIIVLLSDIKTDLKLIANVLRASLVLFGLGIMAMITLIVLTIGGIIRVF